MDVIEIRRRNFVDLVDRMLKAGKKKRDAAIALGMSASMLSQLLGGKKMGDDLARDTEAAAELAHGWFDRPQWEGGVREESAPYPVQSHATRIDPAKLPDTIRVVKHYLEFEGESLDRLYELPLLLTAYRFVDAETRPMTDGVVIDLTKRLAARLREKGVDDVERREVEGPGPTNAGMPARGKKSRHT